MSKNGENVALSFGQRLRTGQLQAWHLGLLLAGYNSAIILAIGVLALASMEIFPLWVYLLVASPVFFTIFWLWFSQSLLKFYHRFSAHDTLLISKISVMPFLLLMLLSAVALASGLQVGPTPFNMGVYYTFIFSTGSILLGLTVTAFGLRHRIRITNVPEPKKKSRKSKS